MSLLSDFRRVLAAGFVALSAGALSEAAAVSPASAQELPVQRAVIAGGGTADITTVQYGWGPHGPPPRNWRRYGPPPPYYRGPPPPYRRGWGPPPPPRYRPGWGPPPPPPPYYRRDYRSDVGGAVAAGIAGLAAGAIIGSTLSGDNAPPVRGGSSWLAYCSEKYRSFDPSTGTYQGYDGKRYACQ